MRARRPHSPTSCRLTGRTVSPEGRGGDGCNLQAGSHLSAQEGREGGCCFRERGDFLPLFLSCRTQQIKPPRTANQQLILAEIPKGPELLQCRFLHSLLPCERSCLLAGGCSPEACPPLSLSSQAAKSRYRSLARQPNWFWRT